LLVALREAFVEARAGIAGNLADEMVNELAGLSGSAPIVPALSEVFTDFGRKTDPINSPAPKQTTAPTMAVITAF
jgi:hypothetical protein